MRLNLLFAVDRARLMLPRTAGVPDSARLLPIPGRDWRGVIGGFGAP